MRGGERCLEVFCELFPDADIFTLLYVKGTVSPIIEKHRIRTSFIQHLPLSSQCYRYFLPLFPWAIESFDFNGYDLVISSSHCVAKGIRVPEGTYHLSYIYTPMRYIWDQYEAYFSKGQGSFLIRSAMRVFRPWLQKWDVSSNNQVHDFIAISQHVARRIKVCWDKESVVVYPPVNWQYFEVSDLNEGYYLVVSSLVPYKRVDLAIYAANELGLQLKIIGNGPQLKQLIDLAGPTVEFLGWQSDQAVKEHLSRCKALLFPGEEDFGIVPLEAIACGKPVIAYGQGGILETAKPLNPIIPRQDESAPTGVFFYDQTVPSMVKAIQLFEKHIKAFNPNELRAAVESFDRMYFKERVEQVILSKYEQYRHTDKS